MAGPKYEPRIRNHVPITRTPLTGDVLICFKGKWQVCYQARGKIDERRITAWVYGKESRFFCEVGSEQFRVNLPIPDTKPFFDDQFNYTIEEVDENDIRIHRIAGAGNVSIAIAAYQEAKIKMPDRIIQMRQGMRLVRRSDKGD